MCGLQIDDTVMHSGEYLYHAEQVFLLQSMDLRLQNKKKDQTYILLLSKHLYKHVDSGSKVNSEQIFFFKLIIF